MGAGISVAGGIWFSDIVFVICAYFGVAYIIEIINLPNFELWMGDIGGTILLIVGVSLMVTKAPALKDFSKLGVRYHSYFRLWLKGFLINTINPFTFFFWFITTTALVAKINAPNADVLFYSGIIGTILLTDTAKVYAAKKIQKKLSPKVIFWMRQVAGILLVLFGLVLIVKVNL